MAFNPRLRTLIKFLRDVEARQPVNFSGLCRDSRRCYGMVGRYPSKDYSLSERGRKLLNLFLMKEDEARTVRKRAPRGP